MGFKQTPERVFGKNSYHLLCLVQGQFGEMSLDEFCTLVAAMGFDGIELATWLLALDRFNNLDNGLPYAQEIVATAKKHGLVIVSCATHLQGQILGDRASAKTLQFMGPESEAVKAYAEWRKENGPPRDDPFYVPPNVAKLMAEQALQDMIAAGKLAKALSDLQNRNVPLSGFTGSPAGSWGDFFDFPPHPAAIAGHPIPSVRQVSLDIMVERFAPAFDVYKALGVKWGHECHPTERAMGDIRSAIAMLEAFDKAGYASVAGINFDESHMVWQGVNGPQFIRELGDRIWSVHIKGARVSAFPTRAGLLGGHVGFGDLDRGWDFVTAGCERDAISHEETIIALNEAGFDGGLSLEHEDSKWERKAGAKKGLGYLQGIDLPPADVAFDKAFAQAAEA